MKVFAIVNHPGPNSDVGMLDWALADSNGIIEDLRRRYADKAIDGDRITEHVVELPDNLSTDEVTEELYAKLMN